MNVTDDQKDKPPADSPVAPPIVDPDQWNKIIFENANRNHLHQDNLRWTLLAGYALFFVTSITTVNDPKFKELVNLMHYVQFVLWGIGTLWFLILLVEGWYYNLYVAYLSECEKRLMSRVDMIPVAEYNRLGRAGMKRIHPSFHIALFLVAIANSAHLFQAVNVHCLAFQIAPNDSAMLVALGVAIGYIVLLMLVAIVLDIPARLDALSWYEKKTHR